MGRPRCLALGLAAALLLAAAGDAPRAASGTPAVEWELPVRFSYAALDPALGADFRTNVANAHTLRREIALALKTSPPAPELTPLEVTFSDGVARNVTELTLADTFLHEGTLLRFAPHPVPVDQMARTAYAAVSFYTRFLKSVPRRRLGEAIDTAATLLMDAGQYHHAVWAFMQAPPEAWSVGHRLRFAEACIRSGLGKVALAVLASFFDEWETGGHYKAWWDTTYLKESRGLFTAKEGAIDLPNVSLSTLLCDVLRIAYEVHSPDSLPGGSAKSVPRVKPPTGDGYFALGGWDALLRQLLTVARRWSGSRPVIIKQTLQSLLEAAAYSHEQHVPQRALQKILGRFTVPPRGGNKEAAAAAGRAPPARHKNTIFLPAFAGPPRAVPPDGFFAVCELAVWALRAQGAGEAADIVAAAATRVLAGTQRSFSTHSLGLYLGTGAPSPGTLHALSTGAPGGTLPTVPTVSFDTLFRHYPMLMRGMGRKDDGLLTAHMGVWRALVAANRKVDSKSKRKGAGNGAGQEALRATTLQPSASPGAEASLDASAAPTTASNTTSSSLPPPGLSEEVPWVERLADYAARVAKAFGESHPEAVLIAADSWRASLVDAVAAAHAASPGPGNSSAADSEASASPALPSVPPLPPALARQLERDSENPLHALNLGLDTSVLAMALTAANVVRGSDPAAAWRLEDDAFTAVGTHLRGRAGGDAHMPLAAQTMTLSYLGTAASHSFAAAAIRVVRVCRGDLMTVPLDMIVSGAFRGPHGSALLRWCHPHVVANASLHLPLGQDLSWVTVAAARDIDPEGEGRDPTLKEVMEHMEIFAPSTLSGLWVLAMAVDGAATLAASGYAEDAELAWRKAAALDSMPYYMAIERLHAKRDEKMSPRKSAQHKEALETGIFYFSAGQVRPPHYDVLYRALKVASAAVDLAVQGGRHAAVHHFSGAYYTLIAPAIWRYRRLPAAVGAGVPLAATTITGYDVPLPPELPPACVRDLETGPAWVWSGLDATSSIENFNVTAAGRGKAGPVPSIDGGAPGRAFQVMAPFTLWGTCTTPRGLPGVPTPASLFAGAATALLPPDAGSADYSPWQKACFFTLDSVYGIAADNMTSQQVQFNAADLCLRWILDDASTVRDGIRVALWRAMPAVTRKVRGSKETKVVHIVHPLDPTENALPANWTKITPWTKAGLMLHSQDNPPPGVQRDKPVRCISGPLFDAYALYQGLRDRLFGLKTVLAALKASMANMTDSVELGIVDAAAVAGNASMGPDSAVARLQPRIDRIHRLIAAADAAALSAARLVRSAWVTMYLSGAGGGGGVRRAAEALHERGQHRAASLLLRLQWGWQHLRESPETEWGVTDAEAGSLPGPAAIGLRRGGTNCSRLVNTTRAMLHPRWKDLEALAAKSEHEALALEKTRKQHKVTTVALEGLDEAPVASPAPKKAAAGGGSAGGSGSGGSSGGQPRGSAPPAAARRRTRSSPSRAPEPEPPPKNSGVFSSTLLERLASASTLQVEGGGDVRRVKGKADGTSTAGDATHSGAQAMTPLQAAEAATSDDAVLGASEGEEGRGPSLIQLRRGE